MSNSTPHEAKTSHSKRTRTIPINIEVEVEKRYDDALKIAYSSMNEYVSFIDRFNLYAKHVSIIQGKVKTSLQQHNVENFDNMFLNLSTVISVSDEIRECMEREKESIILKRTNLGILIDEQ